MIYGEFFSAYLTAIIRRDTPRRQELTTNHTTPLHGQIMNIACDAGDRSPVFALAFKLGHREARHAAAELVNETDAELTRLRAEIAELRAEREAMAKQEPFAYVWLLDGEIWDLTSRKDAYEPLRAGHEQRPLYAGPAPIPEGYALVPIEPTPAVIAAIQNVLLTD